MFCFKQFLYLCVLSRQNVTSKNEKSLIFFVLSKKSIGYIDIKIKVLGVTYGFQIESGMTKNYILKY